jgi:16S rRNA (uracil1498-N3)-methyltransferase
MVLIMRKTRVYVDTKIILGEVITLEDSAAHHLIHVLKVRVGYTIQAFDGTGGYYQSKVVSRNKRSISLCPEEYVNEENESTLDLTLVQGISRGQKMDYTIQKAVELGVKTVVPLLSEFSNVKLDPERTHKRMGHWQQIIVNACEQCGRNILPILLNPMTLDDWIQVDNNQIKIVLHPGTSQSFSSINSNTTAISLICGSEGGLSDSEVEVCDKSGYQRVSLGPRILRTETAAIVALAICQSTWGDIR